MKAEDHQIEIKWRSAWVQLALGIGLLLILVRFGPQERSLGANVRWVYLHGAWVWTALVSFCAAAVAGGIGVATDSPSAQRWSIALGRVAAFFWITYLPLSLLAMQTNWNGLFLTEPRWRLGVDFALASLLVQAGIAIMKRPRIASAINLGFALALLAALYRAEEVMHPSSPITSSEALRIQLFFYLLTSVCVYAAAQAARIARAAIRVR